MQEGLSEELVFTSMHITTFWCTIMEGFDDDAVLNDKIYGALQQS